ncbi:MAG: type II secretion system protein GspM [Usitatibacter sp.]
MALTAMNPKQSRQLAVGLLVGAILAAIAAIAIPVWLLNRHYEAALDDATNKLDRYRRIATTRPEVVRQIEAMRAKEPRKFFLRSGATAMSAAEAQEALRAIIEAGGGRLITMQAPTARDEGRYRQISVNVQLTANIFALRKILNAIETNTPYLFIDNLLVRSQVPGNFRPGPGAEPDMFVTFDVSGYAQTGS